MSLLTSSVNPSVGDTPVNAIMVVAIDFGTTFSGYAFSFKSKKEDIRMYKDWGTCVGIPVSFKAPTCVLTNKNGRFVAFGYEAQNRYSCMTPEEASDFHFYEKFKMHLHAHKLDRNVKITSNDGHICKAMDIFAMVLKYLRGHVLQTIKTQTGSTPSSDSIQWVVTVPAIWSDASKQFMREAAHKGELISVPSSNQLIIALEPEAASLHCRQMELHMNPHARGSNNGIKPGTRYLVLDCGGGTLDVTAHELKQNNKISELFHANGGNLGGTQVDEKFIQLLDKVFGRHMVSCFRAENPADWLQMMVNFERVKRSINPKDKTQSTNLPLSFEFVDCYQSRTGKKIKSLNHEGVSFASGMLRISYETMATLFNPVVDGIVAHVMNLLQKPALRQVSVVLLVGGFGESPILQEAIKNTLGYRIKMLVPSEAGLCVMKGAVIYGHSPDDIAERIAQKTYGFRVLQPYDPDFHKDPSKTVVKDNIKYAFPIYSKCILQGEKIKTDEKRKFNGKPSTSSQQSIEISIFQSDKRDQRYTDEEGVESVGLMVVEFPGEGLKRDFEYSITFGNTELLVDAWDPRPGGDRKSCAIDFLSQTIK